MSVIRVSCVQMRSGISVPENVAAACDLISRAAREGAELIATPEMTSLMDRAPGAVFAKSGPESADEALEAFRKLAARLGIWLLVGSLPIRLEEQRCANRSFLIGSDGAVRARYDKIHMFDVELKDGQVHRESSSFVPGGDGVVADIPGGRIGMTVCYDVRFPHLHRDLAKAGAQIIAVPAAFTRITGEAHWHVLLRARAIETGSFVIAPAQEGRHEDGRETFGHSLIIGPWGDILAEAPPGPGVIHARLDLDEVARVRRQIPALVHDRAYRVRDGETPE
ncbi:MAG: carbon-nitrogen hydrolase family protein [Alphaproteobacteria bacterium]|nr:carbon-nitrogen hydrolase family protein [Alphaproteobacteria bacterium]